jgi:hypothetical protein
LKALNSSRRPSLESLDDRCLLTAIGFDAPIESQNTDQVSEFRQKVEAESSDSGCGVEDDVHQVSYSCDDWDYFWGDSSSDASKEVAQIDQLFAGNTPGPSKGIEGSDIGSGGATEFAGSDADDSNDRSVIKRR